MYLNHVNIIQLLNVNNKLELLVVNLNKKLIQICLFVAVCSSFTSCASIIHGRRQEVSVTSNPAGAVVSDGRSSWTTPAVISLKRKQKHILTVSKPGYETQSIELHRVISGAVAGNLILGGLPGWGVDAISGAQWRIIPETIAVQLRPQIPYQCQADVEKCVQEKVQEQKQMQEVAAVVQK